MLGLAVPVVAQAVTTNRRRTEKRETMMAPLRHATAGHQALVFIPPLYGPYLQHPLSFLRNEPNLDGPVVYALDQGRLDFDVIAALPHRQVFTLSMPSGFPGGDSAHIVARVDRAKVRSGREIDVAVQIPRGLRRGPYVLRVAVRSATIDLPFGPDGIAHVRLAPAQGGISVLSANGPLLQAAASRTTQLRLAVIETRGASTHTLIARNVPFHADRGQLALLWPGTISIDKLPNAEHVSWLAE